MSGTESQFAQALYAFSHLHQTKETTMIQPMIIKLLAEGGTNPLLNIIPLSLASQELQNRCADNALPKDPAWWKEVCSGEFPVDVASFVVEALVPWYFLLQGYDTLDKEDIPQDPHKALALTTLKNFDKFRCSVEFHTRSFAGTDLKQHWPAAIKGLSKVRAALHKNQDKWTVAALAAACPRMTAMFQWFWTTYAYFELGVTRTAMEHFLVLYYPRKESGGPHRYYTPDQNKKDHIKAIMPNWKDMESALLREDGTLCLPIETDFTLPVVHLSKYAHNYICEIADDFAPELFLPKETSIGSKAVVFEFSYDCSTGGRVTLNVDGTFETNFWDGVSLSGDHIGTAPEYDGNRKDKGTYTVQGRILTFTVTFSHYTCTGDYQEDYDLDYLPKPFYCYLDAAEESLNYNQVTKNVFLVGYPARAWMSYAPSSKVGLKRHWQDTFKGDTHDKEAVAKAVQVELEQNVELLFKKPYNQVSFTPYQHEDKAREVWAQTAIAERIEGKLMQ